MITAVEDTELTALRQNLRKANLALLVVIRIVMMGGSARILTNLV